MAVGPKVDIGRDLKLYVNTQASFDIATNGTTAGENYPVAADAIRPISASAGGSMPFATREDKFGTATYIGGIRQKMTAEASFDTYLSVNGTAVTAPDIAADLLVSGGWELVDTSAISSTIASATNATLFVVASATGFTEGGGVAVQDENDSTTYHLRRIKTVAGTSITVEPPLPDTPTGSSKVVKGCLSYKPTDSRESDSADDTEAAVTVFVGNNRSCDRVASFIPTSFNFSLGGEEAARLSVSGTGRAIQRMMGTTLAEALDASETAIDISNAQVFAAMEDLSVAVYYRVDDEVLKVESISGDTLTVGSRGVYAGGGAAATHDDGAALVPHMPDMTVTGGPVPATSGFIMAAAYGATEGIDLQMGSATFDCGFGVSTRDNVHGTDAVVDGYTMNTREVSVTLSGWTLFDSDMEFQIEAAAGWWSGTGTGDGSQQMSVVCQQGSGLGSSVALVAPRMRPTMQSLDRGAEEVTLESSGTAEGTSAGEDEILLIYS